MLFDYDNFNRISILNYAKKMVGKTFKEILEEFNKSPYKSYDEAKNSKSIIMESKNTESNFEENSQAKGELGNFIEKYYFGYDPNSDQDADFKIAGVEVKQTPINVLKNGEYSAGERLVITMISYKEPVEENFYKSHLWDKIKMILLIHYIRDKTLNRYDYEIKYVNLFTPPNEDLPIIIEDYHKIINKIKAGDADKLSESDTLYLGACTKGSTALKSLVPQYYDDHKMAKRRSFCFKRSYMDYILKNYVINNKLDAEKIIKNADELKTTSFEDLIISKIARYYGESDFDLMKKFDVKENKIQWASIIYKILGISGNKAEEFIKANIKIKSIRVEENGNIREHMPLPTFKFKEIVYQDWENSDLYKLLSETKYLFVLFYKKGDRYYLKKAQFWNMDEEDLDIVKDEWIFVRDTIRKGVKFYHQPNGTIKNNLLGSSESKIIHVRPHTARSAYKLSDGYIHGDLKYADELPDGQYMTQQSFWINKEYLIKKLIA